VLTTLLLVFIRRPSRNPRNAILRPGSMGACPSQRHELLAGNAYIVPVGKRSHAKIRLAKTG
jgi:hypothetical protein